ncbi:exo-poly-alpha-D-galacturonosidase [Prevotella sp. P5-92]|uniref:glycoside hydrolase family 28 protein n=1 Tax=Prevotella sp. P5-92 TaxID=2024222 RepID=UPI000B97398B|nr:glycosyl hydrolase family 28 protein [Prevotella sp. P5-92]OYP58819.1 exo-poly-alpha-D-galacturonosidase [Prevotella sp. P5-92]
MAKAEDYKKYYQDMPVELRQVTAVAIPENTVTLTDFGGVGDGVTLNTEAFRKAISALTKKGGGRLVVPQGVWLTGPIQLKDNIDLHITRNAIVLFSPDKSLFVDKDGKSSRCDAGIKASKRKNIAITGEGIVDGNGAQWRPVKRGKVSDVEWKRFKEIGGVERGNGQLWYPWDVKAGYPNIAETPEQQEKMRQDLVRLTDCENVLIKGVTFQNSPRFHVHPCNSRNVIIDGVTVRCPWNAQNGDAIDISDCHQVLIVNSIVDAGDDGLCMKSGNMKPTALVNGCEDILIQDNTVFHAHGGFVIGSESITGMKRIVVRQCQFSGTDTGLRFKSGIGRGGKTEDIFISDIVMNDITDEAIVFQCDYVDRPAGHDEKKETKAVKLEKVPDFTDIDITRVVCRGTKTAIKAKGVEGLDCIHDIKISNSTIVYSQKGLDIDENSARLALDNVQVVKDEMK